MPRDHLVFTLASMLCSGIVLVDSASADVVFVVNSVVDQIDDNTGDGVCHTAANTCTLRAAVMQANKLGEPGATIRVPAGNYVLTIPPSGSDLADSGDLNLETPNAGNPIINLYGSGPDSTRIDAAQLDRVVMVHGGRTATIAGFTLRNGLSSSVGGAIRNEGTLNVSYCTLSDSTATGGGGIYNDGTLVLYRSTVTRNHAADGLGGGIYSNGDSLDVSQSTLSYNETGSGGGGIYNYFAPLRMTNSTVSHNKSSSHGGGVQNVGGTSDLFNVTVAYNEVAGVAGGYYDYQGTATLRNTVIAGNHVTGSGNPDDCWGSFTSFGRNKVGAVLAGCTVTQSGAGGSSSLGSLTELGALQANGGWSETHALVAPSDMIDGAEPTVGCTDPNGNPLISDQRGGLRPTGTRCDLGAVENDSIPSGRIFADDFESGNVWAW